MNIRFYNARILTMDPELENSGMEILKGEIWVQGNEIIYIGDPVHSPILWDREIDVEGNLLMPGFKNAHTHSPMTFLRSYADDLPLQEWLTQQVFPMEDKLLAEDVYWFSILAIMEYLTSGITSNFDMYFHLDSIVKASVDTGFRTTLVSGFNDGGSIETVENEFLKYNAYHDRIRYFMGFHAEYTTGMEQLKRLARLCERYKAPVFTHNSETLREVKECQKRYAKTPTVLFDSLGLYDFGGGGYHCVYLSEEDMDIFAKKKLVAVTNPASNLKLASGIAPIQQLLDRQITLAIGTDGPASNNCLDMFREMFLVTGLAKVKNQDASSVCADEVLKMAVLGGAKAMGLNRCDCLRKGKLADLIMIDLKRPNMQPIHNIVKNLVYSGSKQNVKMTMVDGKILYEDGRFFIGVDELEVYKKVEQLVTRCKNQV